MATSSIVIRVHGSMLPRVNCPPPPPEGVPVTTGCGVAVGALLVVGAAVDVAHPARVRAASPAITNLEPRTMLDLSPAAIVSISLMWHLNASARSAASVAQWSSVVSHLPDNSPGRLPIQLR